MTRDDDEEREVIYVEREGSGVGPILFGALLGLAAGLLFAPQSGEETRRVLQRRMRRVRALAEEKFGELSDRVGSERRPAAPTPREEREEVRDDLERRLAAARARRRGAPPPADEEDDEEPVA